MVSNKRRKFYKLALILGILVANLNAGEKVIKGLIVNEFRKDIYLGILSRFGQIKRMSLASIDNAKHSRPVRFMKLLTGDEVIKRQNDGQKNDHRSECLAT